MKESEARRGSNEREKRSAMFEAADYFLDLEASTSINKSSRGEALFADGNVVLDNGYVSFLGDLQECWEAKFVEEEEEEEEVEEEEEEEKDDDDPAYSLFLENLKEYGNAYMCDVSKENGVLFPIMYEVEDDSANEIKRKTPRSRSGNCVQDKRNLHQNGGLKSRRKNAGARNENVSRGEVRRSFDADDNHGLINSDYRNDHPHGIKRKTPRSHKGDYVKEIKSLGMDNEQRLRPKTCDLGKNRSVLIDETYNEFLNNLCVEEKFVFYQYGDQKRIFYEASDQQLAVFDIEPLERDIRPPSSTLRPSTPTPTPPNPPSRTQITTQKKPTLTDNLPNKKNEDTESSRAKCSAYWKTTTLHDYLRKPYDQEEYDDLWQQLTKRSRVLIHRESRAGGSNRQGHMGKSYLERHKGLHNKIMKAESNLPKVLNLLRMLRYYIQNCPSIPEDIHVPWTDEFTKSILPESS